MTVKSRLSRRLRKSRRNRSRLTSHASRCRGLRLEPLEARRLLTGTASVSGLDAMSDGPEGEAAEQRDFVPGQLIVEFARGASEAARNRVVEQQNSSVLNQLYGLNFALIDLPGDAGGGDQVSNVDMEAEVAAWQSHPEVSYAAPNHFISTPAAIPDDPQFPALWGLHNTGFFAGGGAVEDADIDAVEAWDTFTGTSNAVVAVIDTGIDYMHEDLDDNMWRNPGEIPGNGIDDDGNGYVDDVFGIAPANGVGEVDPRDFMGHGTHVAGTIGAEGNNGSGVTGVNWDVQLMAINSMEGDLGGTEWALAEGISYATMMREEHGTNVVVSNNSYQGAPGGPQSVVMRAAIDDHIDSGILFVAAAGNDGTNTDVEPVYPASYDLDGIISVAATDWADQLTGYSNFGRTSVDLAAPGGDTGQGEDGLYGPTGGILSTWSPDGDPAQLFNSIQGTSMATPHVAGVAALLRGLAGDLNVSQTKEIILESVDPVENLQFSVLTGGRLNANNALNRISSTQIEGTVWNDTDGDGTRDSGEAGVADWTVYLDLNNNNSFNAGEPSAVTDADGQYSIAAFVAPGTYTVRQVLEPNWERTFPSGSGQSVTIQRRGDRVTGVNFGNQADPGAVSGVKWHDLDGDGVRDDDEPGREGIWIFADLNNNGTVSLLEPADITAADGSYKIHGIPAGTTVIREALPLGWETTYPAAGYHSVNVESGSTMRNINFGNFASFDYGDAPAELGYPTLEADGGAYHGVTLGYQLGELIDSEADGLPSPAADGDDTDNSDDEDGIILPETVFQGTTASIDVTVQTSGYQDGYLQGWIDFNADGDWSDAGEQVISDERLGEGTHTLSFDIPTTPGFTAGDTFARFRYAPQSGLSPRGKAEAGEVEDYPIQVLANEPVANDDVFEVEEGSVNNTLDVLDNPSGRDFPSATGQLNIVEITQPDRGTVFIGAARQTVVYTPDFGVSSPPNDVFTYTIDDTTGKRDTATVTVVVQPEREEPVAVDDAFHVTPSGPSDLEVLNNDLTGVSGTMQLVSFTNPGSGSVAIDNKGTSDPLDDTLRYTPDNTFDNVDQFEYTISNAEGMSTATVTVFEDPPPNDLTAELDIHFEDSLGTPVTEVDVNDEFHMVVSIQDVRGGVSPQNMGMFSAFLDVLYDRELVLPVLDSENPVGVDITYSSNYGNALNDQEGDSDTPGLLNEVGSFTDSFSPLGNDLLEVFRVSFSANAIGTADFRADPADASPLRDILFHDPPVDAELAEINYDVAPLTIGPEGETMDSANLDSEDVNADGYVSPMDALLVITHLNQGAENNTAVASAEPFNSRLDVNADSHVSPLDALMVISYLNGTGSQGEGEADPLAAVAPTNSSDAETDDLLDTDPTTMLTTLDASEDSNTDDSDSQGPIQEPSTVSPTLTPDTEDWKLWGQDESSTNPEPALEPASLAEPSASPTRQARGGRGVLGRAL